MIKKNTTFIIIIIFLAILLLISIILNIVLLNKLNTNNSIIGVYYNEKFGKIEILDDKNAMILNNTDATYSIIGNEITFNYKMKLISDKNGKCYSASGVVDCLQDKKEYAKIVDNGIIYKDSLFNKLS